MLEKLATALLAALLLSFAFIDLELAIDLGPWHANAPIADIAALGLLPIGAWMVAKQRANSMPVLPWLAFLGAGALSLLATRFPTESLHFLVRKPLFMGAAYGVGLAGVVGSGLVRPRVTQRLLLAGVALTALVLAAASLSRIATGGMLWWAPIAGLTPNHKTLAVALAGTLPLVLGMSTDSNGDRRAARVVGALALVAIAASLSKTAWIGAAFAMAWFVPRGRPIGARPWVVIPALVVGVAAATAAPIVVGSRAMLDAARSRHSLNKRSLNLFLSHPLMGAGAGVSTLVESVTFPEYRVNGVDAHGVVQKVGGETGALGLGTWCWFTGLVGLAMWRRRGETPGAGLAWGCVGAFTALHLELGLSTEAFSPTHWAPLGVAWGLTRHHPENAP
jgi:hypothetical protein